jgi:hypothetical protein
MRRYRKRAKGSSGRVEGPFLALPWDVLDSAAFRRLSGSAVRLLLELGRQFVQDNNGRLLTSLAYLGKRGWNSAATVTKAVRELEEAGFIHQTVKGHRPNKASWWALTWQSLDRIEGYDPGAYPTFKKGAYRDGENTALIPVSGAKSPRIAPKTGASKGLPTPQTGAVEVALIVAPIPKSGNHLEKPSARRIRTRQDGEYEAGERL